LKKMLCYVAAFVAAALPVYAQERPSKADPQMAYVLLDQYSRSHAALVGELAGLHRACLRTVPEIYTLSNVAGLHAGIASPPEIAQAAQVSYHKGQAVGLRHRCEDLDATHTMLSRSAIETLGHMISLIEAHDQNQNQIQAQAEVGQ
jgi:hypothetical protein